MHWKPMAVPIDPRAECKAVAREVRAIVREGGTTTPTDEMEWEEGKWKGREEW